MTPDAFPATVRELDKSAAQPDRGLLGAAIRDARRQTDALAGQIRAASRLASGSLATETQAARSISWRRRFYGRLAKLRANLSPHSTAFRHAIRLAVCVGIGDAIGRSITEQRTYWIPMTIAIILRPDFTSTFSRGVLRLAELRRPPSRHRALSFHPAGIVADIAMMTVFAFLLRWIGPANYGIFVPAVSALIVLFNRDHGSGPE